MRGFVPTVRGFFNPLRDFFKPLRDFVLLCGVLFHLLVESSSGPPARSNVKLKENHRKRIKFHNSGKVNSVLMVFSEIP